MKKKLFYAAFCAVALSAACSKDAGEDIGSVVPVGQKETKITLNTGYMTRTVGGATTDSDKVYFNPDGVTVIALASDGKTELVSKVVDLAGGVNDSGDTSNDGTDVTSYTTTVLLPENTAFVNMVLNNDVTSGTGLSNNVNDRQGATQDEAVVLINKYFVPTAVATAATNGKVNDVVGGQSNATLTVGPEMARIEMVNNLEDTAYPWTTSKPVDVEITTETTINPGTPDQEISVVVSQENRYLTNAQIATHFRGLKIENIYLDNSYLTRNTTSMYEADGTTIWADDLSKINDSNVGFTTAADWKADYATDAIKKNLTDAFGAGLGVLLSTDLDNTFAGTATTDYESFFSEDATDNSVGYNLFRQAIANVDGATVGEQTAAAKSVQPHYIVELSYFPATAYNQDVANEAAAPLGVATAWAADRVTVYVNFAAFYEGSTALNNFVKFESGKVLQFNLSSVLDAVLNIENITAEGTDNDTTENPDSKEKSVAITVDVLDWDIVPVTPMPL